MDSTRTLVAMLLTLIIMVLGLNVKHIDGLTIPSTTSLQPDNDTTVSIKQPDDTVRVDPLDHFNKYRGGYDITNKHYWSSTIFTGVNGYAMGVLWLVCGVWNGLFLLATTFCCKRNSKRKLKKRSFCYNRQQPYLWHILLATFFTTLAIVASGLVLGGNARFHSEVKSIVDIIMKTANEVSGTISNTTEAMTDMRDILEANNGINEASLFLTSTSEKLGTEGADIEKQATEKTRLINEGLKIVYIILTLTISFNLIAVIALSVAGILRFQRALISLIVMCWFLTVLCWCFFGAYFFLERFSTDTCTALESFQENPNNNSLNSILPCNELLSAKPILLEVGAGIYNLVNEVNANISLQETSYPILVRVCNPFSAPPEYHYQPENCPANSVQIGDIPKVLKLIHCSDANNGTCEGEFQEVDTYSSSVQELLNAYPGMGDLVECQSVKGAFAEILEKHCKPLKKCVRLVWSGMVFLSVVMVVLIVTWTTKAHHEQHHQFSDGSVKPQAEPDSASVMESGVDKDMQKDSNPSSVL